MTTKGKRRKATRIGKRKRQFQHMYLSKEKGMHLIHFICSEEHVSCKMSNLQPRGLCYVIKRIRDRSHHVKEQVNFTAAISNPSTVSNQKTRLLRQFDLHRHDSFSCLLQLMLPLKKMETTAYFPKGSGNHVAANINRGRSRINFENLFLIDI